MDLPLKVTRKATKKHIYEHKRIYGKSIDQRPEHVNDRLDVGHWEIDTVLGRQKDSNVLLTLTERKTRMERIYLIEGKKSGSCESGHRTTEEGIGRQFHQTVQDYHRR